MKTWEFMKNWENNTVYKNANWPSSLLNSKKLVLLLKATNVLVSQSDISHHCLFHLKLGRLIFIWNFVIFSTKSSRFSGKLAESEVLDITDRLNALTAQNNALANSKRKLEGEVESTKGEIEEALEVARSSEERSRKSISEVSYCLNRNWRLNKE